MEGKSRKKDSSAVFKIGTVTLVFLIIVYQAALFIHRAAILRLEAKRDRPDTVYIVQYLPPSAGDTSPHPSSCADNANSQSSISSTKHSAANANFQSSNPPSTAIPSRKTASPSNAVAVNTGYVNSDTLRRNATHSARVKAVRASSRKVESFRFNPNTISVEDLMRLGFSEKQAQSIDNYRSKGGQFRRKSDFARSFVVSDSVYRRLESYIDIPLTDINLADSAAFDALPGIGPYYAAKMVEMRQRLAGYSHTHQLMDIWQFDSTRFASISDLITCSEAPPYPLWSLPAEELRKHPYIANWSTAKAIVLYRDNTTPNQWTVEGLRSAGILPDDLAAKLSLCKIASPEL